MKIFIAFIIGFVIGMVGMAFLGDKEDEIHEMMRDDDWF